MNMKTIEISIDRQSVFHRVAMTTAYVAVKNDDGTLCDRLPVVEADEELMDELWREACTAADDVLRAYLQPRPGTSDDSRRHYRVRLALRHCSWAGRIPTTDAVRSFLVADLLCRWVAIVLPTQVEPYRHASEAAAEQLRRHVAAIPHRVRKYVPF